MRQKPELLAPAGDMEKLKVAVAYGADAVYLGGQRFSLRAGAGNFTEDETAEAIHYAHARGVKVYVAVNIFASENDMTALRGYFKTLAAMGADAFIVSDPGVFSLARREAPETDIHISTQANVTNAESVRFWQVQGAKRVVLARETPLSDIQKIRDSAPEDMRLEAFVHGAMCVAYSGRCLLSHYLTGRNANHGECAHPCRYQYYVMEEKRPGQYLPIAEDERGVSLFASNDLCMVAHLPEMLDAGLDSFKIEGRMKSSFYVAVATGAYRQAIDDLYNNSIHYKANIPVYEEQLRKAAHRGTPGFTTGFYFNAPGCEAQDYSGVSYTATHVFTGMVTDYNEVNGMAAVEQRNKFSVGDEVEIIRANGKVFTQTVRDLRDEQGYPVSAAPHPRQKLWLAVDRPVSALDMICRKNHE